VCVVTVQDETNMISRTQIIPEILNPSLIPFNKILVVVDDKMIDTMFPVLGEIQIRMTWTFVIEPEVVFCIVYHGFSHIFQL